MVLSIVFFFLFYLLLLGASGALVVGCFYAGLAIILNLTSLLGIIIGVGIMALGVLVFWFLIKFLFRVQRTDESGMIEVKEADQPELFAFLRKLTTETQTPFPKKVLLSPEVNASVFYNSSFWSMFLPVRKNLVIGLGLVNALNLAELKAVMAHEFGHFSQRSMKLGSYVYQVNRVMYNMLFDNEGYGRVLQGFSSIHGAFGIIAQITVWIVTGIQKILQWMYGFINTRYMSLSRQMEFHADAVAASVSGGNHLIQALRRIELADSAWNETVEQYNKWLESSKKAPNAFTNQRWMINRIAQNFKLHVHHDQLPFISDEALNKVKLGRVNIENQWASHPAREDREKHLNSLGWQTPLQTESAWAIFNNMEQLQQEMTNMIYRHVQWKEQSKTATAEEFEVEQVNAHAKYSYPESFREFLDGRYLARVDLSELNEQLANEAPVFPLDAETANLPQLAKAIERDIELLKAIEKGENGVRFFDFDGEKKPASKAGDIRVTLEEELTQKQRLIALIDNQLLAKAMFGGNKAVITDRAKAYQTIQVVVDELEGAIKGVYSTLEPLLQGQQMDINQAQMLADSLRTIKVPLLRGAWEKITAPEMPALPEDLKLSVTDFLSKDYYYFAGDSFFDSEINQLIDICKKLLQAGANLVFDKHKAIWVEVDNLLTTTVRQE